MNIDIKTSTQSIGQTKEWSQELLGAAMQGCHNAQNHLGEVYKNGRGVDKDYEQAVLWLRKAAEQGFANAQLGLGVMYANGRGVDKDYEQAVLWYRKAAEQGNANAMFNLGLICYCGRGGVIVISGVWRL